MNTIIPFVFYIVLNSEVSILTKTEFGKCMPITFISSSLLFYFVCFIDIRIGLYALYMLIFCFGIYILSQKHTKISLHEYVLTPGLIAFVLLFVFTALLNKGRNFSVIDDWVHWGRTVKEIYRLGTFYSVPESIGISHKTYPPFFSIVESSYCILANTFSEGMCLQSLQLFSLSLFLPLFDKNKKHYQHAALLIVIILYGNVVAYTNELTYPSLFYDCTYVDWSMAFYTAYMFYLVIKQDYYSKKDYTYICIAMCGFILTKQISIVFVLLVLIMLTIKLIIKKRINLKLMFCIISPLLTLLSWNIYILYLNVPVDFSTGSFDYLAIIKFLGGSLSEYQTTIISNFIYAFFLRPVIKSPISIPYFWLLLMLSLIVFVIGVFNRNRKEIIVSSIILFLGGIGYAYSVCLSYMYTFDSSEALTLTMYNRYMLMYIVVCYTFIFYLVIDFVYFKIELIKLICLTVCILLLTNTETLKYNYRLVDYNKEINDQMVKYKYFIENLNQNEKVLLLWQHDIERINAYKYNTVLKEKEFDIKELYCNEGTCNLSENDFLDLLSKYDYLYICDYDDNFIDYWELTNNDGEPYNDTAYKIKINDNGITLNQVN